jgi:UDP-N-acetylglucosamine pyrophosphorylase
MELEATSARVAAKMEAAGVTGPTVRFFLSALRQVSAGERGLIREADIEPVRDLPRLRDLALASEGAAERLRELAVIKLNGGLGTSMGLERAKSLIPVKDELSFLDLTVRQVLALRSGRPEPAFYLMNSFSTRSDTLAALEKYPEFARGEPLDFVQSKVPKLDAMTLEPVSWPEQPELEWCPPGHGDIYPSLLGSGLLDRLLARGIRVLFVSNADNLGATVDLRLLRYFGDSNLSFLMEVAERTVADRKGGHLARRRAGGRLVLRESAQSPADEEANFQDIERHRFFNTNNLWLRLDHLRVELDRRGGLLPLPLITNAKTLDPRRPDSPRVWQLESAMGAAIECFERSGAVVVERDRFAPVKTTSDLLVVRSDAYRVTEDYRLVLAAGRGGHPPWVELDPAFYRVLAHFDARFPAGPPSLVGCERLGVEGAVRFAGGVICRGRVKLRNRSATEVEVPAGIYDSVERAW